MTGSQGRVGGPVLLLGLTLAGANPAAAQDLPVYRDTVVVEPARAIQCLPRPFILASTFRLTEDGRTLEPGAEYSLDPDAGCITLLVPDSAGAGRVLVASYRCLPVSLLDRYQLREDPHRRRAQSPDGAPPGPARPATFTGAAESEGLRIAGSKTFGVEVGTRRDLRLRQSLDVRLTGRVGRDATLLAILSDQDVPFQPEGNTAELDELDRVLIELRAPRAEASLGDIRLETPRTSFLELSRELTGFSGGARFGAAGTRGVLASAKGEFVSRELFAVDGKQGPYRLTDRTGLDGVVVVAGTERVWLDGESMRRGEEEDYVIDYATGEITFTPRRALTANSRIAVDYQVATGRYQRQVTFAGAESVPLGPGGDLLIGWFAESDDPDDPVGGELSDAERDQLTAVGDSATVSGGTRFVGGDCDSCDYKLTLDPDSGREIFVYVEGGGDYVVAFVDVGDRQGEYEPDPALSATGTAYVYVGPGNGRFIPRRDLPAPERRRLSQARWTLTGTRGGLEVEAALSDVDGNVLSPRDDQDNRGGALIAEARLAPVPVGRGITVAPRAVVRRVGENFRSPTRFRPSFYGRDWNLIGTESIRDETLTEAAITTAFGERLTWDIEAGRLALADTFQAVRHRQTARYRDSWIEADGAWTLSRDDVGSRNGELDRHGGGVTLRRWPVSPRISASRDVRKRADGSGERSRNWESALAFPIGSGRWRGEVGMGRRLDDSLSVGPAPWDPVRDARTSFAVVNGSVGELDVRMRYDRRRVVRPGEGDERRDTGRLDLRHQALRGSWRAVLNADVGTVGLQRRSKTIVPDSTGSFDAFGNFTGPGGGFDLVFGPPGAEELTGRVDLTARARYSPPGGEIEVPRWLRLVAWDGFLNLVEVSALPLNTPGRFLDPGSYLDRETTLDGRLSARQTVDVFPRRRTFGVRLRQESRRNLNSSLSSGDTSRVEIRAEDTIAATLRSNPGEGWDVEGEVSRTNRREEVEAGAAGRFRDVTRLELATARGGRRLSVAGGSARVSAEASLTREVGESKRAVGWILRPRIEWSRTRWGRLDARLSITELTTREGFTGLFGTAAPSLIEGWRLDVVAEGRASRGVVVTGVLGVDRPRDRAPVTRARFEVRGTF